MLHAATWDDLQWAMASGAGAARQHIATAVDEDQRAGLAAERAMRCARHVSECREERDAVAAGGWARLRRARRRAASRVAGTGEAGASGGSAGRGGGKRPAAPPSTESLREAALRRGAARKRAVLRGLREAKPDASYRRYLQGVRQRKATAASRQREAAFAERTRLGYDAAAYRRACDRVDARVERAAPPSAAQRKRRVEDRVEADAAADERWMMGRAARATAAAAVRLQWEVQRANVEERARAAAESAQAAVEALLAKRAAVVVPTTLETIRREILRDSAAAGQGAYGADGSSARGGAPDPVEGAGRHGAGAEGGRNGAAARGEAAGWGAGRDASAQAARWDGGGVADRGQTRSHRERVTGIRSTGLGGYYTFYALRR